MRPYSPKPIKADAFTLLEVILALAILAGSVAVIGEIMSVSGRHASEAQAETRAQMLARSVMNELMAGVSEFAERSRTPLEVDDSMRWLCSVTFGTANMTGLTAVEVLVEQDLEPQFNPVKFKLVSWVSNSARNNAASGSSNSNQNSSGGDDA